MQDFGFIRASAITPDLRIGDISYNAKEIIKTGKAASADGASFIVFPELSITGYSIGDLFHQELVWQKTLSALEDIRKALASSPALVVVGAPLIIGGFHANCAVVLYRGRILAVIPKTYLPGYKEFYEKRWFASAKDITATEIELGGQIVPVGTDILIKAADNIIFGIEICEDLWGPLPPSSFQAVAGATIIGNLSASNELVGKSAYRRDLVKNQSARCIAGYVYASSGVHESSTDLVFSGHSLIAENGTLLKESELFQDKSQIISADIDVSHCVEDRIRTTSFADSAKEILHRPFRTITLDDFVQKETKELLRPLARNPFLPTDDAKKHQVAEEVFNIQVAGLVQRLRATNIKTIIIGLSGGLDSTLALLVALNAAKKLNLPYKNIRAFTMPGFGTTKRTKSNAHILAEASNISIEEIDITEASRQHFKDIHHDERIEDPTFENVQARYRTMILMDKANQLNGLVLGTGDLSEIALGWATFNGDHISHYNVNVGVPKTLIRHVVSWVADTSDNATLSKTLKSILDTPISPELKRAKAGKITQKTEDLIGPYELHDFFLYHFIRWGSRPQKILFLAEIAYKGTYSKAEIKKWLTLFIKRFFGNQWKRSVASDGPKIGSVALSPRGDWRMPSDASVSLWLKELD
ncbi:MAG: synthase [Parcubacteria group bacterium]|nr:synthase [Parcubacteria group bacterium]